MAGLYNFGMAHNTKAHKPPGTRASFTHRATQRLAALESQSLKRSLPGNVVQSGLEKAERGSIWEAAGRDMVRLSRAALHPGTRVRLPLIQPGRDGLMGVHIQTCASHCDQHDLKYAIAFSRPNKALLRRPSSITIVQ